MLWFKRLFRRTHRASACALQRAVDALPATDRQIYLLIAAEQLSYREVASRLGITIDRVESGLARALSALEHCQPAPMMVADDFAQSCDEKDEQTQSGRSASPAENIGDAT